MISREPVALEEMLEARERRVLRQQELLAPVSRFPPICDLQYSRARSSCRPGLKRLCSWPSTASAQR